MLHEKNETSINGTHPDGAVKFIQFNIRSCKIVEIFRSSQNRNHDKYHNLITVLNVAVAKQLLRRNAAPGAESALNV